MYTYFKDYAGARVLCKSKNMVLPFAADESGFIYNNIYLYGNKSLIKKIADVALKSNYKQAINSIFSGTKFTLKMTAATSAGATTMSVFIHQLRWCRPPTDHLTLVP
jgi:hypothetical protein